MSCDRASDPADRRRAGSPRSRAGAGRRGRRRCGSRRRPVL